MQHECKQEDNIGKLFELLNCINIKVELTNQLLIGNEISGVKGLCGRVADLEKTVSGLNNLKMGFLALGGLLVLILDKFSSIINFLSHITKG